MHPKSLNFRMAATSGQHRRLRRVALVAATVLSLMPLTARASTVEADTATATIGQATCTAGDTAQPTILALDLGGQTDGLPQAAVDLLSYVHPGSVCTMSATFYTPALALPTAMPPGSGIGGGCQQSPCDGQYYGTPMYDNHNCGGDVYATTSYVCIAEFDQIQYSFGFFSDGFNYISGESLDGNNATPDPETAVWQGITVNYNNSDGLAVSHEYVPETGLGDGPGWRFSAANNDGQRDKDKSICWVPGGQITCAGALTGYRIHVGQQGYYTQTGWGTSITYCSLADFAPYLGQITFATGNCAPNP